MTYPMGGFTDALRQIRVLCPTDMPIRVRRRKLSGEVRGLCTKRKKCYEISIEADMPEDQQIETLIHEVAHALSWPFEHGRERTHGPQWGVAYAAIYHALVDLEH